MSIPPPVEEPEIITLGCRLNAFESEVMRRQGRTSGQRPTVIVNTCAVTGEAERQARQTIRRLRRDRPEARIIVTGCAAQLHPEAFAAMPEVDRVLGNREKLDPRAYLDGGPDRRVSDILVGEEVPTVPLDGFSGRARAYVQVQQGCDHRCTFCIVPFTRGPNRAVPPQAVIDQVRRMVAAGHKEVVLTGIDVASYDTGDGAGLGALARQVLQAVPDLPRLRLSTVDPAVFDSDLVRLIGDENRLAPHLHLSLQSGDDTILKRMKRRHSVADAARFVDAVRAARPETVFGADLIAGFPTETADQAATTEHTVADLGLTWLHVFPYSPRPGTPAARMPQVPAARRKVRAARLRELAARAEARHWDGKHGTVETVLIEEPGRGRGADFTAMSVNADLPAGELIELRLTRTESDLKGDAA